MEDKKIDTMNMSMPKSSGEPADNGVTRLPDGEGAAQGAKVFENKAKASESSYNVRRAE